jgi:hypothetical protein
VLVKVAVPRDPHSAVTWAMAMRAGLLQQHALRWRTPNARHVAAPQS